MSDTTQVLQGKVALVTGAAGTMGLAATRVLLEDGCKVAMVDFNRERNIIILSSHNPKGTTDALFIQAFNRDIVTPKDFVRVKYPDLIIVAHRKYIEAWRGVTIDAEHSAGTAYKWSYTRTPP